MEEEASLKIGVVIPTLNEAPRIEECIKQFLSYADFILVFDSGSTDGTRELAHNAGANAVVHFPKTGDQGEDRNLAIDMLPKDINWVLIADADERFPLEFLREMHSLIENNRVDSFRFPRDNFGIKYQWPDYQVKLVKRWVQWIGHPHCLANDPVRKVRIDQVSCITLDQYVIQHLPRRTDVTRKWWLEEPVPEGVKNEPA